MQSPWNLILIVFRPCRLAVRRRNICLHRRHPRSSRSCSDHCRNRRNNRCRNPHRRNSNRQCT